MLKNDIQYSGGQDWLSGGGEMGKVVRSKDWSKTPLGPIEKWPQSLRTTVNLCLASNFPISLEWGEQFTQIYNDGYWPICGGKHPTSMGQDFRECWASAWPVIGEAFENAVKGETSFLEDQRIFLDRNGYLEETFFTFSFSPIRDESGGVGGLFHPVTETTGKMLVERRTRALRDLAGRTGEAQSTAEALDLAAQVLASYDLDLPFALFYTLDAKDNVADLAVANGLTPGSVASPLEIQLVAGKAGWPIAEVAESGKPVEVGDLERRFGPFSCGPYPECPTAALVLPITPPGCERPIAVIIAGVSSRLPFNDLYRNFYEQVAASITAAVANARAYEAEKERVEKLAALDRAKTVFFSNVSHELRTPLTLMLGPLEDTLGRTNALPAAEDRENLALAHRSGLRLLKLVNSLLDFSRIEAGRIQASYQPEDLATLTASLASVFRSAIEKGGLQLAVDCPPLDEGVYVDREMWEKIVLNLLSNAFKFTLQGQIMVRQRREGDAVKLSVEDTGCGIAESELENVFKRFYRVERSEGRTYEGSGIGLSLVEELIHLHGGTVSVQSVLGQGSTFTVSLPLGKAHLPADQIGAEQSLVSTGSSAEAYTEEALRWIQVVPADALAAAVGDPAEGTLPYVLVADDNADMRQYLERLLCSQFEVVSTPDGEAAWAALLSRRPDLLLSDVMMPRLDGFGLLARIRAHAETATLPVVLLSARAGEESKVEGLEAGADDYLIKPFSAKELLARVRANLETADLRQKSVRMEEQLKSEQGIANAIRESEVQFRTLANTIPHLCWMANADGWIFWYNERWYEYSGTSPEQMEGWGWQSVHDPIALPKVLERWTGSIATGERFEMVFPLRGADGVFRPFLTRVTPVKDTTGNVVRWFGTNTDISAQKQIEAELRKSKERLDLALEVARVGEWELDLELHTGSRSQRHAEIFGYSSSAPDWSYESFIEHVVPEYRAEVAEKVKASLISGVWDFETQIRRADGEIRWIWARGCSLLDETVKPVRMYGTVMDITERKRAEQEIRELNQQLEDRVRQRTAELEAANKELEAFSYSVSHDLRAPLRAINGFSQAVMEDYGSSLPAEGQEYLGTICRGATRMGELIDDLLAFSRLSRQPLSLLSVDTRNLVSQCLEDLESIYRDRVIDFSFGELPSCLGDRALLKQVWTNLLSNAIKFTSNRQRASVQVGALCDSSKVVYFIKDNGAGFDMKYANKLFGVFQRLHRNDEFEGTGVGLAIVQRIVHRHGGRVWADAVLDQGATFYFTLDEEVKTQL
jgi:PAS domain S-box-containing protein